MLTIRNLDAFYDESQALFDVAIDVPAGARVAVLGRNGAGKSTLLKSIMGAGPRPSGSMMWDGAQLLSTAGYRRARAGMAMVPEDRRIFSHLTVLENLQFAAIGAGKGPDRTEAEQMLKSFELIADLGERYGNQLSGGQQQMVAVARGFMARPRLLLLDEPTEGLAPVIVDKLVHLIVGLCESQKTALMLCEQNVAFARQCTDYLYLLDVGTVVFAGSWDEFDADPSIKLRYLVV